MSFEIGKTYGGYEFLDVIKMSRTEITYRVRNTLLQRLEALTVLPKQEDEEQVERFLREMKLRVKLAHPHIVAFYNAAEINRQLVMTTELVDGVTLAERLKSGPLPWKEAAEFIGQALSAAGCAHSLGIVHRDITPENMMITPGPILKLSNFGLAKAAASPQLTQIGTVLGNLKYISPEQVRGTGGLDARSDLYSLGIVFYEMLTGAPPFASKSQFELMLAQVSQVPKPPSHVNPQVPAAFDSVVMHAVAKEPGQRFQSANEFRSALEAATVEVTANEPPELVFVAGAAQDSGEPQNFDDLMATVVEAKAPAKEEPVAPVEPSTFDDLLAAVVEPPAEKGSEVQEAAPAVEEKPVTVVAEAVVEAPAAVEAAPAVEEKPVTVVAEAVVEPVAPVEEVPAVAEAAPVVVEAVAEPVVVVETPAASEAAAEPVRVEAAAETPAETTEVPDSVAADELSTAAKPAAEAAPVPVAAPPAPAAPVVSVETNPIAAEAPFGLAHPHAPAAPQTPVELKPVVPPRSPADDKLFTGVVAEEEETRQWTVIGAVGALVTVVVAVLLYTT